MNPIRISDHPPGDYLTRKGRAHGQTHSSREKNTQSTSTQSLSSSGSCCGKNSHDTEYYFHSSDDEVENSDNDSEARFSNAIGYKTLLKQYKSIHSDHDTQSCHLSQSTSDTRCIDDTQPINDTLPCRKYDSLPDTIPCNASSQDNEEKDPFSSFDIPGSSILHAYNCSLSSASSLYIDFSQESTADLIVGSLPVQDTLKSDVSELSTPPADLNLQHNKSTQCDKSVQCETILSNDRVPCSLKEFDIGSYPPSTSFTVYNPQTKHRRKNKPLAEILATMNDTQHKRRPRIGLSKREFM
ncbi:hypothetical protein BDB01DRAFT_838796 [Pilobolus umbonatus]|nr:hypothetical protein BDB01DRAFT_838796 [Pilobolus umbonatus]